MKDIVFTDLEEHMGIHNKLIIDLSAIAEQYTGYQRIFLVQQINRPHSQGGYEVALFGRGDIYI